MSDEKTNMREPLLTHREKLRRRRNRGVVQVPGTKAGGFCSSSARERPACGPGGVRCIGGVSSLQALAWNRRTCRLGTVGQSKWGDVGLPGREREDPKRQTPQGAEYRRGTGAGRPV